MAEEVEQEIDIFQSGLVPKHEILSEEEKTELLNKYNISEKQLPRILLEDPVVKKTGAKKGDVLRVTRKSPVAKESYYYRVVV